MKNKVLRLLRRNIQTTTDIVVTEDVVTTGEATDGTRDVTEGAIEFVLKMVLIFLL
jgi:hypothetical protein